MAKTKIPKKEDNETTPIEEPSIAPPATSEKPWYDPFGELN